MIDIAGLLEWIFRVLKFIGAVSSAVFVVDYLRTVNLQSSYARVVLLLNFAISSVLWISILRDILPGGLWRASIILLLFALVDIALISQIFLLHKSRRDFQRRDDKERD